MIFFHEYYTKLIDLYKYWNYDKNGNINPKDIYLNKLTKL